MRNITRSILLLSLLAFHSSSQAIRMDCSDGLTSELPVKFKMEVPEFLYFQVGRADQQEEVIFDLSNNLASSTSYSGEDFPLSHTNLEAETTHGYENKGEMDVVIRANCGVVNIAYAVSDNRGLVGDNGQFLSYDTIETASNNEDLPAPSLTNMADTIVQAGITDYDVVTNSQAKWTYSYTNPTMPMAGLYEGTVTYQATCP